MPSVSAVLLPVLLAVVVLAIALVLVRAARGPGVFDRVLAVNVAGSLAVAFIAVWGVMAGQLGVFDVALLYALVNFSATVAILRFFKSRRLPKDKAGA